MPWPRPLHFCPPFFPLISLQQEFIGAVFPDSSLGVVSFALKYCTFPLSSVVTLARRYPQLLASFLLCLHLSLTSTPLGCSCRAPSRPWMLASKIFSSTLLRLLCLHLSLTSWPLGGSGVLTLSLPTRCSIVSLSRGEGSRNLFPSCF